MRVDVYSAFEICAMTILGNESRRFVDLPEYQRLEAELAKEREKVKELEDKISAMALEALSAEGQWIEHTAAQQAAIAKMREALLTCTPEGFCDFDSVREALAISTNLDALREALALECERLEASLDESRGMAITAAGLRKEAAAHRAKKGNEQMSGRV